MSLSLFNKKTLAKYIKPTTISPEHLEVITSWLSQIESGTFRHLSEIQIHSAFAQQIMSKLLGYKTVGEADNYTVAVEYPVATGRVDLALGSFLGKKDYSGDAVLAPLELKGASTRNLDAIMPGRHKTPVQQAFEYARDIRGAKWVLVSNYLEIRLYAISETSLVYEQFFFKDLADPFKYARFQLLLGSENLLTGTTERLLLESEEADKDISDQLYEDYKLLRENTLSHLIADNPQVPPRQLIAPAQKLLDRILFIAFAEDKGLIRDSTIQRAFEHQDPFNPRPIYQNFIGLFNAVDKGNAALDIPAYNGGLFSKDEHLDALSVSDELCEGFKNLAQYDFDSEVSVTVLGHIFEQSIADLEELIESITAGNLPKPKQKATAVSGKRKLHGVVYTPDSITRFIVANTLGAFISERFAELFAQFGKYLPDGSVQWKRGVKIEEQFWYAWQERLNALRVVDPAVGSGAFMVAAFDYLYAEYEMVNEKLAEITGQRSVLDLNKEILNNNLFGVDINEESIEITKLSLWLKTAERGKPLESLDANFIAGNSLGFIAPTPDSQFYWKNAFPIVFADGGFDVVLGNPPYVRQELFRDIKPWLSENYESYHGVLDLYGYFFELGVKLLAPGGKLGFISNSTFFKTSSSKGLRRYLNNHSTLDLVVDFTDLQVFEGVTTYPAIVVVRKSAPTPSSSFKSLILDESIPLDLQKAFNESSFEVSQSQLSEDTWKLERKEAFTLRAKLTSPYKTIKQVYGSPFYGLKTGLNAAFVIDNETKERLIKSCPESVDILRPFLEGRDFKKWHAQSRGMWLIAIPRAWTRECMEVEGELTEDAAWAWFSSTYPAIANWLLPFAEQGRKRGDKGEFWWELRACTYYHEFEKPKIQYGHFSPEPLFHINRNNAYSNDKSYIIPTSDAFLYGLLNSSVYWFLLKSICPSVRGGFYEVRTQYVETLPVPPRTTWDRVAELAERSQEAAELQYKCGVGFIRRLQDLAPASGSFKVNKKLEAWWLLTFTELQSEIRKAFKGVIPLKERDDWQDYFEESKAFYLKLGVDLATLECELNQEVYKLFELSSKEIALIEQEIAK